MKRLLLAAGAAVLAAGSAVAQVPQVTQINKGDLFQDIVNGIPSAQSQYAPAPLLGNFGASQTGNNPENVLIGGDAATNLFQRLVTKTGTYAAGSSVTATVTYGGPDRWAYWSGASTAMTVSRDTTAADVPTNYGVSFKMARTSGQTGVVQTCMAQEVETVNSYRFQGQPAEFDAHVTTGADFSGTGVTMYIVSGTAADEGMAALAFGINAGGGGGAGWTGQANAANQTITIGKGAQARLTVTGIIPAAATEVGVAICWTPVGTAATNDYISMAGLQLVANSALASVANVTNGAQLNLNDGRAKAFSRRPVADEVLLQQRYFYGFTENSTTIAYRAPCMGITTSIDLCTITFPVVMRVAPTLTLTAGFAATTTTGQSAITACTGLILYATLTGAVTSPSGAPISCTTSAATGAAGSTGSLWDLGTSSAAGQFRASAEL